MLRTSIVCALALLTTYCVLIVAFRFFVPIGLGSVYGDTSVLPTLMFSALLSGMASASAFSIESASLRRVLAVLPGVVAVLYTGLFENGLPEYSAWYYLVGVAVAAYVGVLLVDLSAEFFQGSRVRVPLLLLLLFCGASFSLGFSEYREYELRERNAVADSLSEIINSMKLSPGISLYNFIESENPSYLLMLPCINTVTLSKSEAEWAALADIDQAKLKKVLAVCWAYLGRGDEAPCEHANLDDQIDCLRQRTKQRISGGKTLPPHIDL